MVEAQHVVSTSRIVDTMAEQALLEDILEESKPPIPKEAADLHFLLFSPFRYEPRQPTGSRFRAVHEPGVFYAAETVRTAAVEVSYWRWRFLLDTAGLERLQPCSFTAFKVPIKTSCIDLCKPPFVSESSKWLHPRDYSATQALGRIAREAGIGAIMYQSVRDPEKHFCVAVLTPLAFAAKKPDTATQTWMLAISTEEAIWMRQDDESFSYQTDCWEIL
ncbi:MAG: RES family NAD+ phosphorylase [Chlorobium sp.]|nr:RES family NAD+ phosphorylase [Chlorobium sp.]